jgi:DNA-binding CsgD family transcriptional regulator
MSLLEADINFGFDSVESLLDSLLKSANASEFCRAIVHGTATGKSVQGCHIFKLDNTSHLVPAAGYGMNYESEKSDISAWDDTPVALAVRQKSFVFDVTADQPIVAIPLLRDSIPLGTMGLVLSNGTKELPFHEELVPILAKLGAYCLSNLPGADTRQNNREANGEDLTSRQIQILGHIAEGMVNAEIAAKLMLSESTIRQETVRIYRALGVANRYEAAAQGRALGLIKRTPPRLDQLLSEAANK